MPEHTNCRNVTEGYIRDYHTLQNMVSQLINDYKNYLTSDQLISLEFFRGGWAHQYLLTAEACKFNCQFSDYFYEKQLQPSYRSMIEIYNKLYNEYE